MIAIQIILIVALVLLFWRFLTNPGSHQVHAWIKILLFLFMGLAIIAVAFPDLSNKVANAFGVKTGANLLLYFLTIAFIFTVINLYMRAKTDEKRMVTLVRRVALLENKLNELSKDKKLDKD